MRDGIVVKFQLVSLKKNVAISFVECEHGQEDKSGEYSKLSVYRGINPSVILN